jgi:hypothetical protein
MARLTATSAGPLIIDGSGQPVSLATSPTIAVQAAGRDILRFRSLRLRYATP